MIPFIGLYLVNSSFSTLCYTTQKHVGYQLAPARHRFLERQALGSATGRVKHFCVYYGRFFMMISNRFTDPKPKQNTPWSPVGSFKKRTALPGMQFKMDGYTSWKSGTRPQTDARCSTCTS